MYHVLKELPTKPNTSLPIYPVSIAKFDNHEYAHKYAQEQNEKSQDSARYSVVFVPTEDTTHIQLVRLLSDIIEGKAQVTSWYEQYHPQVTYIVGNPRPVIYPHPDGRQTITIELNRVPPEETPEQVFKKRMLDEEFSSFFERGAYESVLPHYDRGR